MVTRTVVCLFVFPLLLQAQKPDWVKNLGKSEQYNELRYLTGFGMAKVDKSVDQAQARQFASDYAKKNLIEKIRVNVSSNVVSKNEESEKKYSTYFSSAVQSTATMDLQGLNVQFYLDDDNDMMCALATVSRETIATTYGKQVEDLRSQIQEHLANGKKYDEQNQRGKALEEYLACYSLFRNLEQAETVLLAASTDETKAMSELDGAVHSEQLNVDQVRLAVDSLVQRPISTTEDLAWYIIYTLKGQADLKGKGVMVAPFTYQDTRMGSAFSRYFKQALEGKAVEVGQWNVVQQTTDFQPKIGNIASEFAQASGASYVLTGTYWEVPQGVKVQAMLRSVMDSKLVASVDQTVSNSVVASSNQSLKPQNFKEAFADQRDFRTDEVVGSGLNLEAWTNKGVDNLIFTEGEIMTVSVRVNMPCYIRFIYHQADGKRALLVNSYYIDESKVNKVYPIPSSFQCSPPFGAEVLQVIARTEEFEPLETVDEDGVPILKEDLNKFLVATRGFKPVKPAAMQTEQRVTITSMEK